MIKIDQDLLDQLVDEAKASSRKRKNFNFHNNYKDPIQRMLNALEPDTYLPPHRHLNPAKDEIFLVLRGSLVLIEFTEDGEIADHLIIDPRNGVFGGEIAAGKWHTLISLESGTVIFEIKQGPFVPISQENFAPWAPPSISKDSSEWIAEILHKIKDNLYN